MITIILLCIFRSRTYTSLKINRWLGNSIGRLRTHPITDIAKVIPSRYNIAIRLLQFNM